MRSGLSPESITLGLRRNTDDSPNPISGSIIRGLRCMPNNLNKKNYRSKKRSCQMCKPQKMHAADSRTRQQVKADQARLDQMRDSQA